MIRAVRQPPVYSPLSAGALWSAVVRVAVPLADPAARLAERLRARYSAERVVLCGSGTEALQIAIRLAGRPLDGEPHVALPAFSCFDVGAAAVAAGAMIGLYDLEPSTLAPDMQSFERVLREGARVAVVAPLYGVPVDWDALEDCASRYGAFVIEDAAQGQGAEWRGSPLGSLGRLSIISFGRGKGWTGGRGGALLVKGGIPLPDPDELSLAGRSLSGELSVLLSAAAQWALGRPSLYGVPASLPWLGLGETRYRAPRSPTVMSRAGLEIAERTDEMSAREARARRENAAALLGAIRRRPDITPIRVAHDSTPGYLRLPVRLTGGLAGLADRREAVRLGIARSYPSTLGAVRQVASRMAGSVDRWPGGEELTRALVTLPTHSLLTDDDRAAIARLLSGG